eukprot:gene5897-6825_t
MNPSLSWRFGLLVALGVFSGSSVAGIQVGGTRVIFPASDREATIQVRNEGAADVMIQSWIEAQANQDDSNIPFAITPSLARLSYKKQQALRIFYQGKGLPEDRESVFWLSVQEIPQMSEGDNNLQVAFRQRLKLFYRPAKLHGTSDEAAKNLKWSWAASNGDAILLVNNPAEYYVSLAEAKILIEGKTYPVETQMVGPKSAAKMRVKGLSRMSKIIALKQTFKYMGFGSGVRALRKVLFWQNLFGANSRLSCLAALSLLSSTSVVAAQFNSTFLKDKGAEVDLRYFEKNNVVMPGAYSVDLYLNQRLDGRHQITFEVDASIKSADAQPVLTLGLLRELGIDIERLRQDGIVSPDSDDSVPVDLKRIDGASVLADMFTLSLSIDIPHAYIKRRARGYVNPSLWDEGVTALFSNYQLNFNRNMGGEYNSDYGYLGLQNGLNIGGWRLRNDSSISQSSGTKRNFSSNRTYLEHDVTKLKGRFAFGQLYSNGDIFDSTRFRGFQLGSDIGMLPDDETGYAPVVRGIAETHATVEVRQNGYVIYSTSVSPGAFEIRDIYPGGSNGDLDIKIIESDGRERKYSQAYSYLPVMTRRGNFQYSLSLGKYDNEGPASPNMLQGTAVYGATDNLTTYGGVLGTEGYEALNLGIGINSALGGMSLDVTNSRSRPNESNAVIGQSTRFLYSKTLSKTSTTFTMAGYRYSTSGYRTLSEHIGELDYGGSVGSRGRPKNRLDLSINQTLARYGSVFLSAGETHYWDRSGNTRRLQIGYSGSIGEVSYSVSAAHTQSADRSRESDNQLAFSVSIPFGPRSLSQRFFSNLSTAGNGQDSIQTGVSGYLDEASTLSYSAQAGLNDSERSGGVGLGWDAPSAKVTANISETGSSRHIDMTASGSVVAHSDGITFGQPVGETFALIEVPGVKGAALEGATARTDSAGYTVASYVQPYRYNWINLDTQTLGSDVDVTDTSQRVVPSRGAVAKARFQASTGRRVQFELRQADGKKLPFGAQLLDEENSLLAVVDNQSRALAFGIKDHGQLTLNWGHGSCSVPYTLPERDVSLIYDQVKVVCRTNSVEDSAQADNPGNCYWVDNHSKDMRTHNITLPGVFDLRNVPVGSVMAKTSMYDSFPSRLSCSPRPRFWDNGYIIEGEQLVEGFTNVYKSGLAGVGIRFLHYNTTILPYSYHGSTETFTYANGVPYVTVEFVRTSRDVVSGEAFINFKISTMLNGWKSSELFISGTTKLQSQAYFSGCTGVDKVNIPMGRVAIGELDAKPTPFNLDVLCSGAPAGTKLPVKVYFEGSSDGPGRLNLEPGGAKGVDISLTNDRGVALPFSQGSALSMTWTRTQPQGELYRLPVVAKYEKKGALKVEVGKANATLNYILEYN